METDGGVYKIPCVVNGAKMKMILDTGASTLSLSLSIANFLYENDYIKKDDIIGEGKSKTADGSIVNHLIINLRDIEIAGIHLKNIEATVIDGQNAPLLLGQTALRQLGSYTINGSSLVLNDIVDNMSEEELDELEKAIDTSMENSQYYSAIDNLKKIESVFGLSVHGYRNLVRCYMALKQNEDAIEAGKEGLKTDEISNSDICWFNGVIALSYYNLKDYKNSIKYNELSIQYDDDLYNMFHSYFQIGSCYDKIGNKSEAEKNYIKAANRIMNYRKISFYNVFEGKAHDKDLCTCLYVLAILKMDDYDKSKVASYAKLGALCKDSDCLALCEHYDLDYKEFSKMMMKLFKDTGAIEDIKNQYSLAKE